MRVPSRDEPPAKPTSCPSGSFDLECLPVAALGLLVIPPVVGEDPELAVAGREAGLVVEPLVELE